MRTIDLIGILFAVFVLGPLHIDATVVKPGCCPINESLLWKKPTERLGPEFASILPMLNYSFLVPELSLRAGLSYYGSAVRLRGFVDKLLKGTGPLKVGVIGGSISVGKHADVIGLDDWFSLFTSWIASFAGQRVSFRNGCVGGTPSAYMVLCLQYYVDEDVDLLLVEYTMNDGLQDVVVGNRVVMSMERLYRRILQLPSRPAVIAVQVPRTSQYGHFRYTDTSEHLESALAYYYDIPTISPHTVMYQLDTLLKNEAFSYHRIFTYNHPGNSGHKMMADLAVHLLQTAAMDLAARPFTDEERLVHTGMSLPEPMHTGNEPPASPSCAVGTDFRDLVVSTDGWEWVNEGTEKAPKWGMVALQPGETMLMRVDTRRPVSAEGSTVSMIVYFLTSYANMGFTEFTCVAGCTCEPLVVDSYSPERVSQVYMDMLEVTQAGRCDVQATVLNRTSSGGYKFKVTGLVLAESVAVEHMFKATSVQMMFPGKISGVTPGKR